MFYPFLSQNPFTDLGVSHTYSKIDGIKYTQPIHIQGTDTTL